MAGKKKSNTKEVKAKKDVPKKDHGKTISQDDREDTFKYGGLPQRDLKKNLGCG